MARRKKLMVKQEYFMIKHCYKTQKFMMKQKALLALAKTDKLCDITEEYMKW